VFVEEAVEHTPGCEAHRVQRDAADQRQDRSVVAKTAAIATGVCWGRRVDSGSILGTTRPARATVGC
jgi:hypothetical protein